ncbi:integrase catalytic domain-containing protein [Trichonephila clavipes]|nr:integrase catalytic domain-containing protein [Trichonephila clavipes]
MKISARDQELQPHRFNTFKKLSVEDRIEVVKRNNLCFRCFLPHRLKECRSEKNCFCLRPHNSLIHFSRDKTRNPTTNLNLDAPIFVPGQIEGSVETNSQSRFVATGFEKGRLKNVFLSTVRALVKNKYSQWVDVRCLLDVGSQSCLCTRACAEKLQLKMEKINTVVSCVNDASMVVKNCVKTSVANKAKTFERNSKDIAIRRLNSLWKRLSRDSRYLSLYAEFLKEYEELGHLERVVESSEPPTHYYIPHHGVLRPEKLTTKLRIVFNGSSPTTIGISLNDILLKGEVKKDVFETISRFRRHKICFYD